MSTVDLLGAALPARQIGDSAHSEGGATTARPNGRSPHQRPPGSPAGDSCKHPGQSKARSGRTETVGVSPHAHPQAEKFFSERADGLQATALAQLERFRPPCDVAKPGDVDGCQVIAALKHCAVHELHWPKWLAGAFLRVVARVMDPQTLSWDVAIGKWWPPKTQLEAEQRYAHHRAIAHREVWRLVQADPSRALDRVLYDEAGEHPDLDVSGATVERRYQEAVERGALDIAEWKRAEILSLCPKG